MTTIAISVEVVQPIISTVAQPPTISVEHAVDLVATGISMGVLHVLAGPDHLSALATLASGNSFRAVYLGVRWGLGHSTGLIAVAIIFILLKGELNLRQLSRYCDVLVGVFMVVLGVLSINSAVRGYNERRFKKTSEEQDIELSGDTNIKLQRRHSSSKLSTVVTSDASQNISPLAVSSLEPAPLLVAEVCSLEVPSSYSTDDGFTEKIDSQLVSHGWEIFQGHSIDMHEPITQRIVSFLIGLLHGIAGPGGILGVLPAVEMQCWQSAFIYLGSFVVSSTVSMGAFAALYGEVTKRLSATADCMELGLGVFSASMSVIVGLVWVVLSVLGKLDEFFHK